MDQQDNNAVPGAAGQNEPQRAAEGREQPPAAVWGGTSNAASPDGASGGWNGRAAGAQGAAGHDAQAQGQAAQERTIPLGGTPSAGSQSAGWGATPPNGQAPSAGAEWGVPQQNAAKGPGRPGKGNWTARKGLLVGGVAVVVAAAAGAGAGAYAAGNGSAGASANGQRTGAGGQFGRGGQNGTSGQGGMMGQGGQAGVNGGGMTGRDGGMDGGPGGLGAGGAGLNAAVHSEYVVLQGSNYVTMAGQTGTVTEVSATSITVKSEDGFSRTYAVGTDVQVTQGMRQRGGNSTGSTLSMSDVTTGATVRVTALKSADTYTVQTVQLTTSTTGTAPSSGTSTN